MRRAGLWIVAAAGLLAAASSVALFYYRDAPSAQPVTRFQILPPDKATSIQYPTVSPDGRYVVFALCHCRYTVRQGLLVDTRHQTPEKRGCCGLGIVSLRAKTST